MYIHLSIIYLDIDMLFYREIKYLINICNYIKLLYTQRERERAKHTHRHTHTHTFIIGSGPQIMGVIIENSHNLILKLENQGN